VTWKSVFFSLFLHIHSFLNLTLSLLPPGSKITVGGWVYNVRDNKKIAFVELSDGTSPHVLQLVIDASVTTADVMAATRRGVAVEAVGTVVASPKPNQPIELQVSEFRVVGSCNGEQYPLSKPKHSLEHLRTVGHFRPRVTGLAAVTRIRSALAFATHTYFQEQGFQYVHTPIITASDCEGAGEMFGVSTLLKEHKNAADPSAPPVPQLKDTSYAADFFGRPAYLTVSGQLNAEIYACALSKVYTFGPTFRAENSNTTRHLAEFWMIEPEIAFCDRDGCMDIAEGYVRHQLDYVLRTCAHDLAYLDGGSPVWEAKPGLVDSLKRISASKFARCSYTEAIEILSAAAQRTPFELPVAWGMDLPTQMERYLAEQHFKGPVFVYNYPKEIKSFYMRLNDDGKTVAAFDLLVPGIGELVGGSQREERPDVLERRIVECGLDPVAYSWYLDLRRFGTVKHAGFGLGFERVIMLATGMENIRDVVGFPRTPQNCLY
jgi:asparaginyl-tRNA synthetase